MSNYVKHVSDSDFESQVVQSATPTLVDFWAEWCGPCHAVAPILEEVAKELAGKLNIVKVDVDKNAAVSQRFNIRSIPTLILFKDGKALGQKIGALNKSALLAFVNTHI